MGPTQPTDELPYAVRRALDHVRGLSSGPPLDPTLRVTLNFHPDRLVRGEPLLQVMAKAGAYRSQFETGTSNGGLTARMGGARWLWESRIFGRAYDDADPAVRPKYGALNRRRSPFGGAPRFGSSHVRLAPHLLERTTFCFPDSVFEPEHFGVADAYALSELADSHPPLFPGAEQHDPLDDYVEAQVHGVLELRPDLEALVLDPSFRDTAVEHDALDLGIAVEWHDGYALEVDTLREHPDYRGREVVELGCQVARDGLLTPRVIGEAARSGRHDRQTLKRVWHYVARFGAHSPQQRASPN